MQTPAPARLLGLWKECSSPRVLISPLSLFAQVLEVSFAVNYLLLPCKDDLHFEVGLLRLLDRVDKFTGVTGGCFGQVLEGQLEPSAGAHQHR